MREGGVDGMGLGSNECDRRATGCMHGTDAGKTPQVERQADAQASEAANKGHQGQTKAGDSPADFEEWQISASPLRFTDLRRSFLQDQKQIWTSPMRLRFSDTEWLVPFAGITTGLLVTDQDVSLHLSHKPTTLSHYNNLSNVGMGALLGGAAGMWLLSYPSRNQHWRETGLLAGQAALNSLVAVEALKYSLGRERPLQTAQGTSFKEERPFRRSTPPRPGLWQA